MRCSVQDVLRRDELIALRPSGYTWTFFQTSRDPVIQQLQKNLVPFVENDKGKAHAACHQTCKLSCRLTLCRVLWAKPHT